MIDDFPKKWYLSRTVWSGIMKIVLGILTAVVTVLEGGLDTGILLNNIIVGVWGIYDIIIRFDTKSSIT